MEELILIYTERFKNNPTFYYGLTICASWAGVGSLLNSITMTQTYGIVPSLIWSAANIIACILFGWTVHKLPTLREVIRTKVARYSLSVIAIFNIWLNMTGIQTVFSETTIGVEGGTILAYAVAITFVVLLLWRGMIRNILTDGASWIAVYFLIFVITILAYANSGGEFNSASWGLNSEAIGIGFHKALLLLSGPFIYIYFYEMIEYNDSNIDGTNRVNMQKAFTLGGLLFGLYMIFAFSLAFVKFPPALSFLKAILISLIAISTLSTFIFSIYLVFGRKLGLIIDVIAISTWSMVSNLGVMGIWTVGATVRSYLAVMFILVAIGITMGRQKYEERIRAQTINDCRR